MSDFWSFLDSPELWKSVAFCVSVFVLIFPIYRILIKMVKSRAQKISSHWEEALKLRREAENLLWQAQSKMFYKDVERKKAVQKALKEARQLKDTAQKEQGVLLSDRKQEILNRVHNIRQTGLTELKEKVVNVSIDTTADILIHSEKIANSKNFIESGLNELEWILEQKEEKNRLLQAIQN